MGKGPTHDSKGNKRRGKGSGGKGFVKVQVAMTETLAWQHLSPSAAKVHVAMSTKAWAYNGRLTFSAGQAGKVIMQSRSSGNRALQELEAKGFIVRETPSEFGLDGAKAAAWRLTAYPVIEGKKTLMPATREYQRWRPTKDKSKTPPKKQICRPTGGTQCVTGETAPVIIDLASRLRATGGT